MISVAQLIFVGLSGEVVSKPTYKLTVPNSNPDLGSLRSVHSALHFPYSIKRLPGETWKRSSVGTRQSHLLGIKR